MKVPYLSASRLKMAEQCMFQYQEKYDPKNYDPLVLKWKGDHRDNMQAARVGTNIHNALEEWRRPNPKTGRVRRPIFSKLMTLYDEECVKNEVNFDSYQDGKAMIERWFAQRGITKAKILAVEQSFGTHSSPHVLANGTPVFGFIDLTLEHEDGTIELVDYKSQRKPIAQSDADHDVQAGIYLTVAREIWPDRPIRFTFDLLRYGTVTTVWTDEKILSFADWLKTKYEWIRDVTDPVATIGDGCKWCSFVDLCPKAQDLIQNGSWDLVVSDDPTAESQNEMLGTLSKIKAAKSILQKKQTQIESEIKEGWFDNTSTDDPIITDDWIVGYEDKQRKSYIPSEIQRIVPTSAFGQMATVTNASVDRVLPVLPEEMANEVRRSATIKPYRGLTIKRNGEKGKQSDGSEESESN